MSPALNVDSLLLSNLGSPESYSSYIFIGLGNLHTVLNRGYTSLLSQREYTSFPFSPHPWQYSIIFHFCHDNILVGVRWYLLVVLICIYLMIRDVEHLFMCLFAICMFLWENAYSCPLPVVLILCAKDFYIFWTLTPCWPITSKYLLPFDRLPFLCVNGFFHCAKYFNLIRSYFLCCFFFVLAWGNRDKNMAKMNLIKHIAYTFFKDLWVQVLYLSL